MLLSAKTSALQLQELPALPNLKLMLTMLAGVEGIYNNPACPKEIPLVKGEPEGGDPSLTEYGITHVLRHHRNLPTYLDFQRQHRWQEIEQKPPAEQRIGLLGYGTMSKPIAKVLFDMEFDVADIDDIEHPSKVVHNEKADELHFNTVIKITDPRLSKKYRIMKILIPGWIRKIIKRIIY